MAKSATVETASLRAYRSVGHSERRHRQEHVAPARRLRRLAFVRCLALAALTACTMRPQFCAAQFVDPPAMLERLPPVWSELSVEGPNRQPTPAVAPISSWISPQSLVAPAAHQSIAAAPVVEPVPSLMTQAEWAPELYAARGGGRPVFRSSVEPPRAGNIAMPEGVFVSFPPDPEELDSCNLHNEHRLAMIDLMGANELLISAGTVSPVGNGVIDDHLLTGWGIQGAVRHLWCRGTENWLFFSEGGGGFWQNGGNRSYVATSGQLVDTTPGNGDTIYLDDFYNTTLRDLKRATVHAALGTYILPAAWQQPGVQAVQFTGRIGLHWGHARATYQQTPTGDLQNAIASRIAGGSLPTNLVLQSNVDVTDSYFGLFTSGGVSYNRFNVRWGCFELAEVAVGVDLQYTHEYINLKAYNQAARGLSTLAPMATFRIMY